jgi:protocatechuate 3,4-dioxygenase beta subunit
MKPQSAVRVEIWQCDASGRYRHPWAPGSDRVDPHFAGFGSVNTGSDGAYVFKTLIPVPYGGRPPHIHVKLFHADRELLTSQLYVKGQVSQYGSQPMVIDPRLVGENQWRADFDFVIV